MAAPKRRRTDREIFIDKLTQMSNGEQKLIGNKNLREAMGWDEDRYHRIRRQLISESAIIVGKGHGGKVGLAAEPGTKALNVFVSYCHADEDVKDRLVRHLKPLEHLNLIESWHDRKILAGQEWEKEISVKLEVADIVLLLVSVDFINSRYCFGIELEQALERHEAGTARVIPIILRSCMWQYTPFAKIQALPKDAKAVCSWSDVDEALTSVAEAVKLICEDVLSTR